MAYKWGFLTTYKLGGSSKWRVPGSRYSFIHQAFQPLIPSWIGYPGAAALAPHDIGPRDPSGTVDQGRNPPTTSCGVRIRWGAMNGSMFFMGFLVLKIGGIMAFVDGVVGYIFRVSLGPGLGIPTTVATISGRTKKVPEFLLKPPTYPKLINVSIAYSSITFI